MKSILELINEKLILKKPKKLNLDFSNYKECIDYLADLGSDKNLTIKFRNRKTNQGDFCIFIYDKSKQPNYLVGYDGYFDDEYVINFEVCFYQAKEYIENYGESK
jgi:hypothetical protein